MTYNNLKVQIGRQPITVVEIDVDFCSRTYGSAPCTASIGATGAQKCYNTFGTCQDTANYDKTTKTYRFCTKTALLPVGTNIFPCINDVDVVPTEIDTKGLSKRAVITASFEDFPHHDRGVDPYVGESTATSGRSDTPAMQRGTFWGKFGARNKFLVNRPLRVKRGYIDANGLNTDFSTDFNTELYFIERIDYDFNRGIVKITAKDVLKFADNKTAKAPKPSTGKLSAGINSSVTSLTLDSGSGAGYSASGKVRIDDEIISYTSKSTDTLNGLTRGTDGSVAVSHDSDALVQQCLEYTAQSVEDVVEDLLVNYADVPSSYIDSATWATEATTFLSGYDYTTVLSEPTGVQDLIQEISNHSGVNIWWNPVEQEIKFKAIAQPLATTSIKSITDENILQGSLTIRSLEKERLSRVIVRFSPKTQVIDFDKQTDYSEGEVIIDTDAESANEFGAESTRLIKTRWLPTNAVVSDMASRLLNRLRNVPRQIKFRLDAKDSDLKTGDQLFYTGRHIVDENGEENPVKFLVTQSREVQEGSVWEFVAVEFGSLSGIAGLIGDNSLLDYTSESTANQQVYAFISDNSGLMSNGDNGYRIQ